MSFALVDERGRLRGHRIRSVVPMASLLKATLLVAYLRQPSVKARPLTHEDRRLLAPMIRRSDNATASALVVRLRERRIERFARVAGMRSFELHDPWGLSTTSAAEQARHFFRIDRLAPRRHRAYVRRLLASIVPSQRWGIPPVRPRGWRIFFKGGWGSGTGWVTHQAALLERGERRLAVAVLVRWSPSHSYGTQTIRGIAARLLREPLPAAPRFRQPAAGKAAVMEAAPEDSPSAQSETRRANDRFLEAVRPFVAAGGQIPFLCECVDPFCMDAMPMSLDEYAEVRSHPRRFALRPGHGSAAGTTVEENERFDTMENPQ